MGATTRLDSLGQGTFTTSSISVLTVNTSSSLANITFTNGTSTGYLSLSGSVYTSSTITPGIGFTIGAIGQNLTLQGATTSIIATSSNPIIFFTGGIERMRITSSSFIGIGTTTPAYDLVLGNGTNQKNMLIANGGLCVDNGMAVGTNCPASPAAGTIYASSTITTGIDVAENYPTNDFTIEAGDLVAADPNVSEHIIKAQSSAGTRLIGVISTAPGVTLGKNSDDARPVALKGRVPVKVSMENGEIKIGDPITISSVAGIGMKATLSGEIVGYALKGFSDSAPGEIPVFINVGFLLMPDYQITQNSAAGAANGDVITNITTFFTQIGATIRDGFLKIKEIAADVLTAGKVVTDQIEMKDKVTGQTYCVTVANGDFVKTPGVCSVSSPSASTQNSGTDVGTPTSTDVFSSDTTTSSDANVTIQPSDGSSTPSDSVTPAPSESPDSSSTEQ